MKKIIFFILLIIPLYLGAQMAKLFEQDCEQYILLLCADQQINPVTDLTEYYVSEYPVGDDSHGKGTIEEPWATLDNAIEHLEDFYEADVKIHLDTGSYHISKENFYRIMEIQTIGYYALQIIGVREYVQGLVSREQDAVNPYLYHVGATYTPHEVEDCFVDGYFDLPIYENGTDWVILAENKIGNVGTNVFKIRTSLTIDDADHVAIAAHTLYGRGGIEFYFLKISGQNINKSLRFGAVTPTQRFKFEACILTALNFQNNNVSLNQSILHTSKQGITVNSFICNIDRIIIKGDGGTGDWGFNIREGGRVMISNAIIANYDAAFYNLGGQTIIESAASGAGILISDCTTGFYGEPGMNVNASSWSEIVLDTVDYLYDMIDSTDITAVFDTAKIINDPMVAWVNNDHGYRISPENNYNVWIRGIDKLSGVATLSSGTVTVYTPNVSDKSSIFLTPQNSGTAQGDVYVSSRTAGTSFSITSTHGSDDRLIAWQIK